MGWTACGSKSTCLDIVFEEDSSHQMISRYCIIVSLCFLRITGSIADSSVQIVAAIVAHLGDRSHIDWPNDLLRIERKAKIDRRLRFIPIRCV